MYTNAQDSKSHCIHRMTHRISRFLMTSCGWLTILDEQLSGFILLLSRNYSAFLRLVYENLGGIVTVQFSQNVMCRSYWLSSLLAIFLAYLHSSSYHVLGRGRTRTVIISLVCDDREVASKFWCRIHKNCLISLQSWYQDSLLSWRGSHFWVCITFCKMRHGDSVTKPDYYYYYHRCGVSLKDRRRSVDLYSL